MKNDNVLYTQNDSIQALKNDNIYTWKMIISSTLENDIILAFKNDNIYGFIIYVIIWCYHLNYVVI
jgi:hypothetical protein